MMNPQLGYRPIGFLDEDPMLIGRQIHGIDILGGVDQLASILESKHIEGILVTSGIDPENSSVKKVVEVCRSNGRWVRAMRLDFELVD
jgi:FlaA1/EpsC-like NDP-sugar epimerase